MKKTKKLTPRQRKNRRILKNWILALALVLVFVFAFQFVKKQVIRVSSIEVTGNERVKKESIIKASGLNPGAKMYGQSKGQVEGRIKAIPYIKDVKLGRSLFGKAKISVTERKPIAQLSFRDHYVFIDDELRILAKTMEFQPEYLKVTGLSMKNLTLGSYLFYNDRQKDLRQMMMALLQEDLSKEIQSIEVTEGGLKLLTKDDIQVVFSSTKDGPYKVKQLAAVLEKVKGLDKDVTMILMDKGKDPIAVTEDVKASPVRQRGEDGSQGRKEKKEEENRMDAEGESKEG